MDDFKPFIGPLVLLAKSRKAMVAITGVFSAVVTAGLFLVAGNVLSPEAYSTLLEFKHDIFLAIAGIAGVLIAAIAYEDANAPTVTEVTAYEDAVEDFQEMVENAAK